LRTQLHVIPKIEINKSNQLSIRFKNHTPSKKPHIDFNLPNLNYETYIKEIDQKNKRVLFCFNDIHFVFNSFPTSAFHVPKCDSFDELKVITNRLKHQKTKSKRVLKTEQIVKDIVFFTLTEVKEPAYQAEKSCNWWGTRSLDTIYQDVHPLIEKFYIWGRIKKLKMGDSTVFYDEYYQKWLQFDFYPIMFETIAHYYQSFDANSPRSTIHCVSL
jgi:hypothetical protein